MKTDTINYILKFLFASNDAKYLDAVSYGNQNMAAKVIIEPSDFFDSSVYLTERSIPQGPLPQIDGIPVLFGSSKMYESDGKLYIGADLVASAFYMLTRYEECVRKDIRDQHGRYIGKQSIPSMLGFIQRPIVDEYGRLLRQCMRKAGIDISEPSPHFSHIWLTHDVDRIWTWNNLFRALKTAGKRTIMRLPKKTESLCAWRDYKHKDSIYTFPWIVEQDKRLKNALSDRAATSVYFLMGCENDTCGRGYLARRKRVTDLIHVLKSSGAVFGLHPSYKAGLMPSKIAYEKKRVEDVLGESVQWSRNHYLCSREPEDFHVLISNGITDDFTMGYADVAGFRLGTCKAVKWIDPLSGDLTNLTLHPLTVMDCTLDADFYMAIPTLSEALGFCQQLLDRIFVCAGEVVLLWHNNSVTMGEGYQRELYEQLITYCIEKMKGWSDC